MSDDFVMEPFRPAIGSLVRTEADRGEPAYIGKVTHVSDQGYMNLRGDAYVWVTVEHPSGKSRHTWPSTRITAV